jgi:phosphomannomutase
LSLHAQRSIALDPSAPPIGDKLRANPVMQIAGQTVLQTDDLKSSKRTFQDGTFEDIDLPESDVLIYHLDSGARVVVRPSGTEPKLKCYYEVVEPMIHEDTLEHAQQRAESAMNDLILQHQASIAS